MNLTLLLARYVTLFYRPYCSTESASYSYSEYLLPETRVQYIKRMTFPGVVLSHA